MKSYLIIIIYEKAKKKKCFAVEKKIFIYKFWPFPLYFHFTI